MTGVAFFAVSRMESIEAEGKRILNEAFRTTCCEGCSTTGWRSTRPRGVAAPPETAPFEKWLRHWTRSIPRMWDIEVQADRSNGLVVCGSFHGPLCKEFDRLSSRERLACKNRAGGRLECLVPTGLLRPSVPNDLYGVGVALDPAPSAMSAPAVRPYVDVLRLVANRTMALGLEEPGLLAPRAGA